MAPYAAPTPVASWIPASSHSAWVRLSFLPQQQAHLLAGPHRPRNLPPGGAMLMSAGIDNVDIDDIARQDHSTDRIFCTCACAWPGARSGLAPSPANQGENTVVDWSKLHRE